MTTLHITNGDAVGGMLTELSTDPVLPWRDVLHDGPVPGGINAAALRETRARFLAGFGGPSYELVLADLTGRDAQLAAMGVDDHIVLWFEPDLYDQLQLIQILAQLYLKPLNTRPHISIVEADVLLGPLSKSELAHFHERQRTVRELDLELAAEAWEAFTSADSTLLAQFAATESALHASNSYAADRTVVLPYLHSAMRRLLQEFPSEKNGLSRSEQQIFAVLMQGARVARDVYAQSHAPHEDWIWLGDWSFRSYVERHMRGPVPLIEFADEANSTVSDGASDQERFWKRKIRLTTAGERVAKDEANAIQLNGIDRWIGGTHLVATPA